MALLKSLKKVLTELGGTPDPKDSTTKTIDKIADNVSGGGGGSSVLIAKITADENWENYTCDKTFEELLAANDSFTPVIGYIGNETDGYATIDFRGAFVYDSGSRGQASFRNTTILGGGPEPNYLNETVITIDIENTVTSSEKNFTLTPKT